MKKLVGYKHPSVSDEEKAYQGHSIASVSDKEKSITLTPGANVIKYFSLY
jgi:hypothetical protein